MRPKVGLITCLQQNQIAHSIATHPCKERKDGAPSVGMVQAMIVKGGLPLQHREVEKVTFLMKHLTFAGTLLLLCICFPTSLAARNKVPRYLNKESSVDMSNKNHIFVGWVDLEPEAWALYDFRSRADWAEVIASLNADFVRGLQATYLHGRTITAAKDKADDNTSGSDLYIKFSDVRVDYDHEHLILSIHFIDPKSNVELTTIPVRPYYGDGHNVTEYLKAALDEVGTKLQIEVTGVAPGKKKK